MYARVHGDLRADLTIRLMFRRDRPHTGGGGGGRHTEREK